MKLVNNRLIINVVIEVEPIIRPGYSQQSLAATTYLKHPSSIAVQKRLSDEKLNILDDIVESAVSFINAHNFPIIETYQSHKSYSEYIVFQPIDEYGNKSTEVQIKFRIADHKSKTMSERDYVSSVGIAVKSFWIDDEQYEDYSYLLKRINYICDRLQIGDMTSLLG